MKNTFPVKLFMIFTAGLLFLSTGCVGTGKEETAKSMEQLYAEQGRPVHIRDVEQEPFSVYLKFPADFKARKQATAYAKINDVVREINFHVGDHVKRDQVVMSFSMDNSDYQKAKLSFENAESTYKRTKALFAAAGISKQDYNNARTQYELAKEAYKSAGELVRIKAPIDGYITQIDTQTSSNVRPGDALFTVSNSNGFEAFFYVTADEIDDIKSGEKAYIEGKDETIYGHVTEVSLNMDPSRKAFLAKAFFAGTPKSLVSGMTVDIAVEVYNNPKAVIITQKEMIKENGKWVAYTVKDNKAHKTSLITGREQGITYEVIKGLAAGDKLIEEGSQDLVDGEKVRIIDDQDSESRKEQ